MSPKLNRYKGIELVGLEMEGNFYLLEVSNPAGDRCYFLNDTPGRDMSGAIRVEGWLGTTRGVRRDARGCVQAYRDARGALRVRPITAAEMMRSEETSEAVGA